MKLKLSVILSFYFSSLILAQDLTPFAGAFVDIGFGARPAALGNAYVGLSNDINSIIWNPAGLSTSPKMQSSFTYTNLFGLISYNYLAFSMPMSEKQGAGASLITSGDDALREYTLNLAYSRNVWLENMFVGIGVKLRYATFGNNSLSTDDYVLFEPDEISEGMMNQVKGNAFGFGLDLGLIYSLSEKIKIGLMLKDIYSPVFWNSKVDNPLKTTKGKYSELVPFEPTIGTSFKIAEQVTITTDYTSVVRKAVSDKLRAGAEAILFKVFSVRGGMQYFINNEKDEKYSLGFGLNIGTGKNMRIILDYTYMIEEFANTQRISLGMEF